MKKVITMVGISLIKNYREKNENTNFNNICDYFEKNKINAEDLDKELYRADKLKNTLNKWIKRAGENASAEIKSLIKLKKKIKDDFQVYLLYSDTALSRIVAELLKENLCSYSELGLSEDLISIECIKNLQVYNSEKFNEGLVNLINKITEIANGYWDNIVINITGGYKATIPYLTILAQVNRCPIYYIFENTDVLIEIPYIPININTEIFEKYEKFFFTLEKEGIKELPKGLNEEERIDIHSLLEIADSYIALNPLGQILWGRYKRDFIFFFASDDVLEYLKRDKKIEKIIKRSIFELKKRLIFNSDDPDLNHFISNKLHKENFKCFKHKEDNLEVRILYKANFWKNRLGLKEVELYVGLVKIGKEVHNVESEYIKEFDQKLGKIKDLSTYKFVKISKKGL